MKRKQNHQFLLSYYQEETHEKDVVFYSLDCVSNGKPGIGFTCVPQEDIYMEITD